MMREKAALICQKTPLAFRELTRLLTDNHIKKLGENCHMMAEEIPLITLEPDRE
jgi:hypothetical protein